MGLLPNPRGLVAAAGLCLKQPEGIAPSRDELENLFDVAHNPNSLDHQVGDIWVGVESARRDPHHHVRDLPTAVPVVGDFDEDRGIARRRGEMFLASRVTPTLKAQPPNLAQDHYAIILEAPDLPKPWRAAASLHSRQLRDVLLHYCKQRETTHKISHKAGTISSLVPDSKIHKLVSWYRHFNRLTNLRGGGFKPDKISGGGINRTKEI